MIPLLLAAQLVMAQSGAVRLRLILKVAKSQDNSLLAKFTSLDQPHAALGGTGDFACPRRP